MELTPWCETDFKKHGRRNYTNLLLFHFFFSDVSWSSMVNFCLTTLINYSAELLLQTCSYSSQPLLKKQWSRYLTDLFFLLSEPDAWMVCVPLSNCRSTGPAGPYYCPWAAFRARRRYLDIGAFIHKIASFQGIRRVSISFFGSESMIMRTFYSLENECNII